MFLDNKLPAHRLVSVLHVEIQSGQHCDFEDGIYPGLVDQTAYVEHRSTCVVGQHIRHPHQGQTLLTERLTQLCRHIGSIGVLRFHLGEELLKLGRSLLLLLAPAGIEVIERAVPESALLRQTVQYLLLLRIAGQFTTLLTFIKYRCI